MDAIGDTEKYIHFEDDFEHISFAESNNDDFMLVLTNMIEYGTNNPSVTADDDDADYEKWGKAGGPLLALFFIIIIVMLSLMYC